MTRQCSIVRLLGRLMAFGALSLPAFAAEPALTRVNFTSQPSGATVIVDGQDRGVTPAQVFGLTPGRHHLKLRLDGYCECDRFFNTDGEPFLEKGEVLEEVKGLLLLKTEPPGCDIQIDGISVGQTPRFIKDLSARDVHKVRFRKTGYLDQTISVKFDGRKPLICEEKMVLASGTVDVQSDPPGAEITVNGIVRGVSPVRVEKVPKGRVTVRFRMEGFAEETRELSVNAGDEQTMSVALKALPGTLHLISVPEGARFYLNDEARGKGPMAIPGLRPGTYSVRAELEGYGTVTKSLTLGNGASLREEFRLSNTMGRLEVRTSPPGAQILLDGKPAGVTKSADEQAEFSDVLSFDNLLEGEHALVVRKEGFAEVVRHPKIQSAKTSKHHNIRLNRIFVPDVEIVTVRGTHRGVLVSRTPQYVIVEVSLGITRSFAVDEIRKINFLKSGSAEK